MVDHDDHQLSVKTFLSLARKSDESQKHPHLEDNFGARDGHTASPDSIDADRDNNLFLDELIVTFRRGVTTRAIKNQFLVVDFPFLYQCIFGRPTLGELIVVPSTVHLKMKYYTAEGLVATLHGDVQAARRYFKAFTKGLSSISAHP